MGGSKSARSTLPCSGSSWNEMKDLDLFCERMGRLMFVVFVLSEKEFERLCLRMGGMVWAACWQIFVKI